MGLPSLSSSGTHLTRLGPAVGRLPPQGLGAATNHIKLHTIFTNTLPLFYSALATVISSLVLTLAPSLPRGVGVALNLCLSTTPSTHPSFSSSHSQPQLLSPQPIRPLPPIHHTHICIITPGSLGSLTPFIQSVSPSKTNQHICQSLSFFFYLVLLSCCYFVVVFRFLCCPVLLSR